MKRKILIPTVLSLVFSFFLLNTSTAQLSKKGIRQQSKVQDAQRDALISQLKTRPIKSARQAAKTYKKQGFMILPGNLPMEMQLERCMMKEIEETEFGESRYFFADGNGVGRTQTAASLLALETAKLRLAGQLTNEIKALIEGKYADDQIDIETAESLTKLVVGSQNVIIQSLSSVRPAFKVYREVGSKNVEVAVRLYYDHQRALNLAEKKLQAEIRANMEDEADELLDGLDTVFK